MRQMLKEKSFEEVKVNLIETAKKLLECLKQLNEKYPEDPCEERDDMIDKLEVALEIFNELKEDK